VLGNTTNLHQGARSVDATDDVHPSYIASAEGAIALFPGLIMAGVDIAIENAKRSCRRELPLHRSELRPLLCGTS
jgi:hypothetical protein